MTFFIQLERAPDYKWTIFFQEKVKQNILLQLDIKIK